MSHRFRLSCQCIWVLTRDSNLSASNAVVGISQIWDWGWAYKGISISNCSLGLNMSSGGTFGQTVGSITLFDSTITNCPIGIQTAHNESSQLPAAGSLIIENVQFNNVPSIVQGPQGTVLQGSSGSTIVSAWGEGHSYTPNGPTYFEGPISANNRPPSLLSGSTYYSRSKPQYESVAASALLSARSLGAKGDGQADDTGALQAAIYAAKFQDKILFLDAGDYVITSTLYVPGGSRIVGEAYPVILASGSFFTSSSSPKPAVSVGRRGETGTVELSDFIVSGRGALAGAIFIEYNLASSSPNSAPPMNQRWGPSWGAKQNSLQPPSGPSGLWDVHTRVGGFAGSDLQINDCPTTPTVTTPPAAVNLNCIAGFMSMHVTSSATNLYMENIWLWTADHDIEDPTLRQITIYNGRGLYVESNAGPLWLYGTSVEHHVLYEYQFTGSHNVYMGQIQTETVSATEYSSLPVLTSTRHTINLTLLHHFQSPHKRRGTILCSHRSVSIVQASTLLDPGPILPTTVMAGVSALPTGLPISWRTPLAFTASLPTTTPLARRKDQVRRARAGSSAASRCITWLRWELKA